MLVFDYTLEQLLQVLVKHSESFYRPFLRAASLRAHNDMYARGLTAETLTTADASLLSNLQVLTITGHGIVIHHLVHRDIKRLLHVKVPMEDSCCEQQDYSVVPIQVVGCILEILLMEISCDEFRL